LEDELLNNHGAGRKRMKKLDFLSVFLYYDYITVLVIKDFNNKRGLYFNEKKI